MAKTATVTGWKKTIKEIQQRSRREGDPQKRALLQIELDAASAGLKAAQQTAAVGSSFVTGTNLFALTQLVVDNAGPSFPNRLAATDRPHIKRTLEAGLVEIAGNNLRLTARGREAVGDNLVQEIARESAWSPKENVFVPDPAKRAEVLAREVAKHNAKKQRLEMALASLKR